MANGYERGFLSRGGGTSRMKSKGKLQADHKEYSVMGGGTRRMSRKEGERFKKASFAGTMIPKSNSCPMAETRDLGKMTVVGDIKKSDA